MVDPGVVAAVESAVAADSSVVVATSLGAEQWAAVFNRHGELTAGDFPDHMGAVSSDAVTLLDREMSRTLDYGGDEVFFEVIPARPVLFVFGAVHVAQELVAHGAMLGYRPVVADPRAAFLTEDRFPEAELRVGWPADTCTSEELTDRHYVVSLTHDRRFEDPLWPIVLNSEARYIGALGSSRTTAARRARLAESGFTPEQIERIHGPVGVPLGGRTAGETALSILAEMTMVRYRSDEPINTLTGQISRI